jgi:hypothetical protein
MPHRMTSSPHHPRLRWPLESAQIKNCAAHALRPMAEKKRDPSCFYKGWLLCGIDGSSWSVTNTPQILEKMTKAATRRFEAGDGDRCAVAQRHKSQTNLGTTSAAPLRSTWDFIVFPASASNAKDDACWHKQCSLMTGSR